MDERKQEKEERQMGSTGNIKQMGGKKGREGEKRERKGREGEKMKRKGEKV